LKILKKREKGSKMTEAVLIIFAAGLIYYVATRLAPKGLLFKLRKEEDNLRQAIKEKFENDTENREIEIIEIGQKQLNSGQPSMAEKTFLEAIQLNPKNGRAYHFLGMIYLRQNEYKGAIEALKKATELDQLNDTAYNNLGLAYHNLKKFPEAVEAFEKSIQLNDKIAHRYVNLGISRQSLKEYEKAAIAFEGATKIHENVENITLLAKNYIKLGDEKLAKKALGRLLEIDPANNWSKRTLASYKD
jgi:superkiller protein 3